MPEKDVIIRTKNVDVTYFMGKSNEVKALSDISIEINRGELVIFFGPSGCGKSTLLYSIAGLERHSTGEIYVEGEDVVKMDNKGLEKHHQKTIGMIFQAFYLIPSLTVLQNIMMPQIAIGGDVKARKKRATELAEYFGVGAQIDKLPTELSGGQQQRVAICRSLVNDPDIIFADEPVGNLDSKSATDVLSLIQDLNRSQKKTIILVTHDPSHLDIADKIVFLKDGKLVEVKTNDNPRIIKKAAPEEKKEEEEKKVEEKKKEEEMEFEIDDIIADYRAKEVVLEVMLGMSVAQFNNLENIVKELIKNGLKDKKEIIKFLNTEQENGGVGFDKRKAENTMSRLEDIIKEIRTISRPQKVITKKDPLRDYVKQIRFYLLDSLGMEVHSSASVDIIEETIMNKIKGLIDEKGVFAALDADIKNGGAGLDKRVARKAADRLELVLLGRYTGIKGKILKSKYKKEKQLLEKSKDKFKEV